ncbi:MAG: hypothetical protein GX808_01510 [Syntrophomonadaceae bacterium]|nr:hypothetical protein [Syntrophomonadaceae bacterium]
MTPGEFMTILEVKAVLDDLYEELQALKGSVYFQTIPVRQYLVMAQEAVEAIMKKGADI